MEDTAILTLLGFVVTLIAIMTPIIKLNGSITKLNAMMENINCNLKEIRDKTDKQEDTLNNHNLRIDRLENKNKKGK